MTASLLEHLTDLSDPTRGRILGVLQDQDLTVAELQEALQLPQSTASRHLKVLAEGGWIGRRAEGASHRYRFRADDLEGPQASLWSLVATELAGTPTARADLERLRAVLAHRQARSRTFFASAGGQWEQLRIELFGRRFELQALLGLLDPGWTVGDLGCGAGELTATMAPFVRRVVAVDESHEMLDATRARVAGLENVDVRHGELELLPLNEAELDLAVMALVLPYVPEPARVLAEAARALEPGGRLVVVDLQPHDREEFVDAMGHLRLGVPSARMLEWLMSAGMVAGRVVPLPIDPSASGPGLFVATARKPE